MCGARATTGRDLDCFEGLGILFTESLSSLPEPAKTKYFLDIEFDFDPQFLQLNIPGTELGGLCFLRWC